MIKYKIPGNSDLIVKYLVLDYNGTMACDGILIEGVSDLLQKISQDIEVHVVTADTFGKVRSQLKGMDIKIKILGTENQDKAKRNYIRELGEDFCVCMGNGRNDSMMLKEARLGIALIQEEGASTITLNSSDIVCTDIVAALNLLLNKNRLTATLRL